MSHIHIERGGLTKGVWIDVLRARGSRCVLITDTQVGKLWGKQIWDLCWAQQIEVLVLTVPPGESTKSRKWKQFIEDKMLESYLGRDTLCMALGGGVVSDLAGFVAATYCRGIPWMVMPTTLLGQVDASLGGKVGINTKHGKNVIGAFHPPCHVWIDPETLRTLPQHEWRQGMAEVIKYSLIRSHVLFEHLFCGELSADEMIQESCRIKQAVVLEDPQERGLRRILNFGHTIGHALECATHYQMPHGEAVALGMLMEAHLSWQLGSLSHEELEQIEALIRRVGFALQWPLLLDSCRCFQLLSLDKKSTASSPRFVQLQGIGQTVAAGGAYCTRLEYHHLEAAYRWLHSKSNQGVCKAPA